MCVGVPACLCICARVHACHAVICGVRARVRVYITVYVCVRACHATRP